MKFIIILLKIFVISDGYKTIALNWTIDVSKTDGKSTKKKKKGAGDDSDLDIFPKQLELSYNNLTAVNKIYYFVLF